MEENKNSLKWNLKLKLLLDISKGMEYIHFKKLIHRDLKLENVLITKQLVVKITDFDKKSKKVKNSNEKPQPQPPPRWQFSPKFKKNAKRKKIRCFRNK
jgi:serine/threonine protein kinase